MLKTKLSVILSSILIVSVLFSMPCQAKSRYTESNDIKTEQYLTKSDPQGTRVIASNAPFSSYNGAGTPSGITAAAKQSFNGTRLNVALTLNSANLMSNGSSINNLGPQESLWLEIKETNSFGNPGRTIYKGDCVGMKIGREVWYRYNIPIKANKQYIFYVYATNSRELFGTVRIRAYTR